MELRVIIPAAGKGSRLQQKSGDRPKAMFPIGGRPMLDIVLENVSFIEPQNTYIVVGYKKDSIIEHFGNRYHYIEQTEQLGTGHAVMMCSEAFRNFDGNVLVTFGDMPLFRYDEMYKMCMQHEANGAACTLMTAKNPRLKTWARILRDENGNFQRVVEGKDCTPKQAQIKELFSGVMVFNSRELFQMLPHLGCSNVQKEYYVTEVPELMVNNGLKVETYFTKDGDDLRGINAPEDLEICEHLLQKRAALSNPQHEMLLQLQQAISYSTKP